MSPYRKSIDYDIVSKNYDKVRSADSEMVTQILRGAELTSDSLALDVGCGTANNTLLFSSVSGVTTIGLDLSAGMLSQARIKAPTTCLIHAPADCMPLKDESFDLAFMTEVIHHVADPDLVIKEVFRILISSGRFCIVTQSHDQIEGRMTSRFFPSTVPLDQERYPSIFELETTLEETGFSSVQSDTHTFRPTRLGQDYLETVERRGYSMLHKISDKEYERGLDDLRKAFAEGEELSYSAGYTFVWARRP